MSASTDTTAMQPATRGFLFAFSAYLAWGFLPFYMKAVAHISALEVVAHRVVWSLPIAAAVLLWIGRAGDVRQALASPRTMAMSALMACFITVNWLTYVWAIGNGRALETALGYYINPLFSVFLGAVLLGEKLKPAQWTAIALVVVAVIVLTLDSGGLPWVSLALAASWTLYALFKKTLPIEPVPGFFLEVLILSLPAAGYAIYVAAQGDGHFGPTGWTDLLLLFSAGVITSVPLILYANGAKLLRLSTIGIMQYMVPTMVFLTAVLVFHEPFGTARLVAFVLIWLSLAIYSWSIFSGRGGGGNAGPTSQAG